MFCILIWFDAKSPNKGWCTRQKLPLIRRGGHTKDPGGNIDSSELKDGGWSQILWHGAVILLSLITAFRTCLVTRRTQGYEGDQNSSGKGEGGLPSKIFIASSFKSIQLYRGSRASTVRNWAGPVVITSLLISTDGLLAMGSAWLTRQHIERRARSFSLSPSPSLQPISMFRPHLPIMEHT